MEIFFTKLQGNGNDFILIDEMKENTIPDSMKGQFAGLYCDRRYGIGADGILFISKSEDADVRMRLFQPDESEAEMCGNGIRCLAKYALDMEYVKENCKIETESGILPVDMEYNLEGEFSATIGMGDIIFERTQIPATGSGEYCEEIDGMTVYAVNTGVPHAVVLTENLARLEICDIAPKIRHHESFPKGVNVNFVEITGDDEIVIRTFERGVEDETFSCGTGSTASAAVANYLGKTGDVVSVTTKGGPLTIFIEDGRAKMKGPAVTVFKGSIAF